MCLANPHPTYHSLIHLCYKIRDGGNLKAIALLCPQNNLLPEIITLNILVYKVKSLLSKFYTHTHTPSLVL